MILKVVVVKTMGSSILAMPAPLVNVVENVKRTLEVNRFLIRACSIGGI